MDAESIYNLLKEKYSEKKILGYGGESNTAYIGVSLEAILDVCTFLKNEDNLLFNNLMCLSAIDYKEFKGNEDPENDDLGVHYDLESTQLGHKITLKVRILRLKSKIDSVVSLWETADWHEREAYDMMGIKFEGHPDLRRILLPDDWEGYPLKKDYVLNPVYHGLKFKD